MSVESPMRIAVFVSGTGSNLESLFESFEGSSTAEIALVLADREAPGLDRARRRDVIAGVIDHADEAAIIELLESHQIDWVVLAGYLRRIPSEVVARYPNHILNIHPALLPQFGGKGMYGHRVHQAVLAAGESESGVTVHLVDDEYDHGPIVAQRKVPIEPDDTPETLAARVLAVEHQLLPEVVRAATEGRIHVEDREAWIEEAAGRSS